MWTAVLLLPSRWMALVGPQGLTPWRRPRWLHGMGGRLGGGYDVFFFIYWHQEWYMYIYIYIMYTYTHVYMFMYTYILRSHDMIDTGMFYHVLWYENWALSAIFVIADYPHKLSHYIGPISFQCFAFLLVPLRIFRWFHFGCSDLPMVYCPTLQIMILLVMTKSYKHLNTWLFSQMGSPPTNVKTNCSGKFDGKFPILMSLARLHPNSQEVQGGEIIFCSNHLIEFGKVI